MKTLILIPWNKIKKIILYTVGTIPKSNIKIVERGKIDTPPHTHTHTQTQQTNLFKS